MKKIDPVKRLVLAKKLYLHGYQHSFIRDEISRMLAMHNFDNAVELILRILTDMSKAKYDSYNVGFLTLLKHARSFYECKTSSRALPLEGEIMQLHTLRNTIQHSGSVPDIITVERFRDITEQFLRDVTKNVFDLEYEDLSLSLLIGNSKLRENVKKAEKLLGERKFKDSLLSCDEVLTDAVSEVGNVFGVAGELTAHWGIEKYVDVIREEYADAYKENGLLHKLAKDVSQSFLDIGKASTSMQFLDWYRIDFLRHRRVIGKIDQGNNIGEEELRDQAVLSLQFVTNLVLKWQEEGIL